MNFNIDAPEADYLYTETSQLNGAGKGLFTAIEIYKNEIIAVFEGEILSDLEARKRTEKNENNYFINLLDGQIMDSMHVDCFAKYANDAKGFSKSSFKNNAKISLNDDNKVCLIAKKTIKPNTEIFCSYGKPYWKQRLFT
jgi:SET domain-containing protein